MLVRPYRGQITSLRSSLRLVSSLTSDAITILAISIIVITYMSPPTKIFILCDSDNHYLSTETSQSPTRQKHDGSDRNKKLTEPQQRSTNHKDTVDDNNSHFISHGDVYFLVSEPESLRYTFKARSSRIGIPFTNTLSNISLVLAESRHACTSTINKLEIRGNIALVERGGCSFLEKCIEIERTGGIALIVYDYDKHNDENYIEMIDDNTPRNCSIPAVSLLGKDGYMIVHSLLALKLNRAVITIPISVAKKEVSNPPWLMW